MVVGICGSWFRLWTPVKSWPMKAALAMSAARSCIFLSLTGRTAISKMCASNSAWQETGVILKAVTKACSTPHLSSPTRLTSISTGRGLGVSSPWCHWTTSIRPVLSSTYFEKPESATMDSRELFICNSVSLSLRDRIANEENHLIGN